MEAYAIHKMAIVAPRKARMTLDLIRGKKVSDARAILKNTNTKSSRLIIKVLESATANAVNNLNSCLLLAGRFRLQKYAFFMKLAKKIANNM